MSDIIVHDYNEPLFAWGQQPFQIKYTEAPEDFGTILSIEDYLADIADGNLMDCNGHGYPMKDGKVAKGRNIGYVCEFVIVPSKGRQCIPKDATHIVWYNR